MRNSKDSRLSDECYQSENMRTRKEIEAEYNKLNDIVNQHISSEWRRGKSWNQLIFAHQALSWVLNDDFATCTDGKTLLNVARPSECI
jgi:hypothetical protein